MPTQLPRSQWIRRLRTGLRTGAWDFVRQAAAMYLTAIPNDLEVRLLQGEAWLHLGHPEQAYAAATAVALADPEDVEAHRLRWRALPPEADADQRGALLAVLAALGRLPQGTLAPAWGVSLRKAYQALTRGDLETAQETLFPLLPTQQDVPLLAVAHLRLVWAQGDWAATLHLARSYYRRWPQVLPIRLLLAHHLAESGQETESVALLHQAAIDDPAGQVVRRLFGETHPYRALWPDKLEAPFDMPLPASVAAALGQNQLPEAPRATTKPPRTDRASQAKAAAQTPRHPAGPPSAPSTQPTAAEKDLARAARRAKQPQLAQLDGRFPVYVVWTTRRGLESRYGQQTARILLQAMHTLADAVRLAPTWDALVLVADDPTSALAHGVKPAAPADPWALKKQLAALDQHLRGKGSMIGALLIVGGPEVVPFHRLPNPIADADDFVLSDNPYGALDENYLAPTWPVGRLPGSADGDAGLLLTSLRRLAETHRQQNQPRPWYRRWWLGLRGLLSRRRGRTAWGYSAAVWAPAAQTVFQAIGSARKLWTSPPLTAQGLGALPRADLGYFNLHGLADAAPWYGQRDPLTEPDTGADYPVALRPEDLTDGRAPRVIFTEACYGAHIQGKTPQNAMALGFLYHGTLAFVGSTVTAYGAVDTPLAGADLLGHLFWQRLKAGLPAGEALRQAKYIYAHQIHRRQGFLDGEDQKTLISFVLYGDPLLRPFAAYWHDKGVQRPRQGVAVRTAEEMALPENTTLPPRLSQRVQKMVKTYLPGGNGTQIHLAEARLSTTAKGQGEGEKRLARKVVMVSREIAAGGIKHRHVLRVTLDAKGKVVKVTISR